jgi:hypothetical protein
MKRKRPQQGTHGPIRSLAKEAQIGREGERMGAALADLMSVIGTDPDVAAYVAAQRGVPRDFPTINRLLPVLRGRYGVRTLLTWHRINRWRTTP